MNTGVHCAHATLCDAVNRKVASSNPVMDIIGVITRNVVVSLLAKFSVIIDTPSSR